MVADLVAILNNYGNTSVERIKQNLASTGTNATGRTSQSLRYTVTDTGDKITLQIIGKPYLAVVETGRRPTPEYTKPSYDFVNSIKQWIAAKGGDQSSAYAIAKNIHQKGTKLYQDGGRKDIISNVINQDLTAKISQDVLKAFGNLLVTNIKSIYGSNRN